MDALRIETAYAAGDESVAVIFKDCFHYPSLTRIFLYDVQQIFLSESVTSIGLFRVTLFTSRIQIRLC